MKRSVMLGVCAFVAPFGTMGQVASAGRPQTVSEPASAAAGCPASSPILEEMIQDHTGTLVVNRKNRYISISAGDGSQQAIRVTFSDLPAPYHIWNGLAMWVGPPQQVSTLPSIRFGQAPCCGEPTFWAAPLQCDPYFDNWTSYGTVHVWGEAIIPGAAYCVQVVDTACPLDDEASYSSPTTIPTSRYGDITGTNVGGAWTATDGSVGSTSDISAVLAAFIASNPLHKTRADVVGVITGPSPILDGKITISDILEILNAFVGASYPFSPSVPDPCPGAVIAGGIACPVGPFHCGNGATEPGEECDDGNNDPGDGCDSRCRLEGVCGNGVLEFKEECDDGGTA